VLIGRGRVNVGERGAVLAQGRTPLLSVSLGLLLVKTSNS
jgi:hypothetical protein